MRGSADMPAKLGELLDLRPMLRGLLFTISRLPMWVLYRWADILAILMCYLLRYRRKVVVGNLRRSFPDKSPREIRQITRKFYWHLADIIVETLKLFTISEEELKRRVVYRNTDRVEAHYQAGRPVIHMAVHSGNWELFTLGHSVWLSAPVQAAYVKLAWPWLNDQMLAMRQKFGADMVPRAKSVKAILQRGHEPRTIGLVADQRPMGKPEQLYWIEFLNQPTAFFLGGEKIAPRIGAAVFYNSMRRIRRGYYEVDFIEIDAPPYHSEPHFITNRYRDLLQELINERPSEWLWSHKRWKVKPPANVGRD